MLSIGALSRATGVPVATLRTWERRYGFPAPQRKESGQRVYPLSSIERLQRIAAALSLGHRAAEVLAASDDQLTELCQAVAAEPAAPRVGQRGATPGGAAAPAGGSWALPTTVALEDLMLAVESFDSDRLTRLLLAGWARSSPLGFLEQIVAPLVRAIGEAWEQQRLDIRHEHFLSEKLSDLLRTLRLTFEERARGPLVILTTLSGEPHALGLQMAALIISSSGCRVLSLGTESPVDQVAQLARQLDARAVGVSVSMAGSTPQMREQIGILKLALPAQTQLVLGGEGAPELAGARVISSLADLSTWSSSLMATGGEV